MIDDMLRVMRAVAITLLLVASLALTGWFFLTHTSLEGFVIPADRYDPGR
jgi:hypothetical protein